MILNKIISFKHIEVTERKEKVSMEELQERLSGLPPTRSLTQALRRSDEITEATKITLLAEIKFASPSKGAIRPMGNLADIARQYTENGAAAISVLTDTKFFKGSPDFLTAVRQETNLPLLRKDFVIDPYQIYEARVLGADAVLLIAAVLSDTQLSQLMALAGELGLQCLTEVHTAEELRRVMELGSKLIGINNRDLTTFRTDIQTTFKLRQLIDRPDTVVISESGINTRADMVALQENGVDAALVGEALMRSPDIGQKVRELLGV